MALAKERICDFDGCGGHDFAAEGDGCSEVVGAEPALSLEAEGGLFSGNLHAILAFQIGKAEGGSSHVFIACVSKYEIATAALRAVPIGRASSSIKK